MVMGINAAIIELEKQNPTDLFFVAMCENGRIFGGFQCPHGPDMEQNISLYHDKLCDEVNIARGRGRTLGGILQDMERDSQDVMTIPAIQVGHLKYEVEVRIIGRKEGPDPEQRECPGV